MLLREIFMNVALCNLIPSKNIKKTVKKYCVVSILGAEVFKKKSATIMFTSTFHSVVET